MFREPLMKICLLLCSCLWLGGSVSTLAGQANGVPPLRIKVKFTSNPDKASLSYPSGSSTKAAKTPVSLIMNLNQGSTVEALFKKSGYRDCRISFTYKWLTAQQAVLVVGNEQQPIISGSMRDEDAPVVHCDLVKKS